MFAAAKIRIRKLTPGKAPGEHIPAIVATALSIARKQVGFTAQRIELGPIATEHSGEWLALGRATVHPAGASRSLPKRTPSVGLAWRMHGESSEAAD